MPVGQVMGWNEVLDTMDAKDKASFLRLSAMASRASGEKVVELIDFLNKYQPPKQEQPEN